MKGVIKIVAVVKVGWRLWDCCRLWGGRRAIGVGLGGWNFMPAILIAVAMRATVMAIIANYSIIWLICYRLATSCYCIITPHSITVLTSTQFAFHFRCFDTLLLSLLTPLPPASTNPPISHTFQSPPDITQSPSACVPNFPTTQPQPNPFSSYLSPSSHSTPPTAP